jgi:Tat protein translocase TatB subunit
MFDVGFAELVLLFMLGLIVLGPEKLPRIAAQIGRWVGRARRTATQLRYQLEREINLDDRPRRPYSPPPKTSQIVPPPGAQRDDDAGDQAAAADAAEPAAASTSGADEANRDTAT